MTLSSQIDEAILAVAKTRLQKVAMILVRAAERLPNFPQNDIGFEIVGQRLAALVKEGRLIARGDISRWRHSEVQLPDEPRSDSPA